MNLINTKRQTKSHKEKEVSETAVPHYLPSSLTLSPPHRFILEENWSQISTYSFSLYGRLKNRFADSMLSWHSAELKYLPTDDIIKHCKSQKRQLFLF